MANATTSKETTQLRTMSKVSKVCIQLPGGLIRSNIDVFCPQKLSSEAPDSVFQFRPKTSKKGSMPRPRNKLPSLEQCQRSRTFTSSYRVVSFQAILNFSTRKSRVVMPLTWFFGSVPKRRKMGQCHSLKRNYPA